MKLLINFCFTFLIYFIHICFHRSVTQTVGDSVVLFFFSFLFFLSFLILFGAPAMSLT